MSGPPSATVSRQFYSFDICGARAKMDPEPPTLAMYDSIWINGRVQSLVDARVSPASAGALYGWGVFTTLGVARGAARAFEAHWERLSAHAARARVPMAWTRDEIGSGLAALVAASGIAEGRARITILRASAGLWRAPSERESDALVFVAEHVNRDRKPLALTISPYRINTASPLAGIKATAYVDHLVALEEARAREFDEAVRLNERGEIVEATAANIFWARDGELFTPSLSTGCLAGITRRFVIEAATRRKIRVTEGSFPLSVLGDADELFLTNSGWGLLQASELDIHRYRVPGPMSTLLSEAVEAAIVGSP